MAEDLKKLFPTVILQGKLGTDAFNRTLEKQILEISKTDKMGREWSRENYRGGYTSYGSLCDLHRRYPCFQELEAKLLPHINKFARAQGWEIKDFEMTACWANLMSKNTHHTLHLHPHSIISGAYYVSTPPGSVSLRLEDPRMSSYMNAPVRSAKAQTDGLYYEVIPKPGTFVLFESWLRHEVPPNQSSSSRISISFNYSQAEED